MADTIVAFDLGTGGVKAAIFGTDGACLAEAVVPYQTFYPALARHEQRPADWWVAIAASLKALLAAPRVDAEAIRAIAISGHSLGCIPISADGELLQEFVPIWSDGRATGEAEAFFTRTDRETWYRKTGNGFPAPLYTVFKAMWLRVHEPDVFARTRTIIGTKDYINLRLTGNVATDPSYASGTGVYDLEAGAYDAALLEAAGLPVARVEGAESNVKITRPEDLARVTAHLAATLLPRVGTGFDVHRFAPDRPLILCGVTVPHPLGLAGHSDADVGIHALCDAIYGALAEGDIGRHFPPSQAAWKDADSARFLRHAAGRIAARGGVLANADVTLICERPKIGPHAEAMRARLAELLGTGIDRISVKATTTERLGFAGRGEGIAAQAVATVLLPA